MHVAELWRYPVKSMAGEPLTSATLGPLGIEGDRVVQVRTAHGRVLTSRSKPRLLLHHATLGRDGEPWIDGQPWREADVEAAAGRGATLVRDESAERFDILPLLVATDGAIAAFGHDRRRLRPNIIVAGVPGLEERTWGGRRLHIGRAVIGIEGLRPRCIMTTFDPDTAEQDVEVLEKIRREFGGALALNAFVLQPGVISVRDEIRFE